jgi:ankyrin repeat protein
MGGGTALHAAAVSDSLRRWAIAKALLDHGADLSIRGKGGQTALSLAIERGDEDMVKLLRKPAKAE